MAQKPGDERYKKLEIIIGVAGLIIAAIALIPAFGSWWNPREPSAGATPAETTVPTATTAPTATAAPTVAATAVATKAPCPAGLVCYSSTFDTLDPTLFCQLPENGYELRDGKLRLTAGGGSAVEVKPCPELGWNLAFVELTVTLDESSGQPGHAFAGIGASLSEDRYLTLQLDSAGQALAEAGVGAGGSEPVASPVPVKAGAPHTLRIEFTGTEAVLTVDGVALEERVTTTGLGTWFLLSVKAWPAASVTASLDAVTWGVRP